MTKSKILSFLTTALFAIAALCANSARAQLPAPKKIAIVYTSSEIGAASVVADNATSLISYVPLKMAYEKIVFITQADIDADPLYTEKVWINAIENFDIIDSYNAVHMDDAYNALPLKMKIGQLRPKPNQFRLLYTTGCYTDANEPYYYPNGPKPLIAIGHKGLSVGPLFVYKFIKNFSTGMNLARAIAVSYEEQKAELALATIALRMTLAPNATIESAGFNTRPIVRATDGVDLSTVYAKSSRPVAKSEVTTVIDGLDIVKQVKGVCLSAKTWQTVRNARCTQDWHPGCDREKNWLTCTKIN